MGLNLPQLVDAAISANSAADPPAFTFAQGFTPLNAETVNRSVVQWRIQDPEPGHADRPPVQHRPRVPVHRHDGGGGRVRRQPHPQRPTAAQPEPGRDPAGQPVVVYPYAQYGYGSAFLEQIVSNGRADYDSLQMRMQKRMSDGLAFTAGLHLEQRRRATSSIT